MIPTAQAAVDVRPDLERRLRDLEAVARLAEQPVVADVDAVEEERRRVRGVQAELLGDRLPLQPRRVAVDEERARCPCGARPGPSARRRG